MLTETEKSYIAGIVDGEGTITIAKSKRYLKHSEGYEYNPLIIVYNTDYKLIKWLKTKLKYGCILKDGSRKTPNRKQCYKYSVGNRSAINVVKILFPYLRIKKKRAKLVLKYPKCKTGGSTRWRKYINVKTRIKQEKLYQKSKIFNKQGENNEFIS